MNLVSVVLTIFVGMIVVALAMAIGFDPRTFFINVPPWQLLVAMVVIAIVAVLFFSEKGRETIVDGIKKVIVPVLTIAAIFVFLAYTTVGQNLWNMAEAATGGRLPSHSIIAPVEDLWSDAIRLTGDKCIFYWGEDPDGEAFVAQVRTINDPQWIDWEDRPSSFAWIRFQSTSTAPATVSYEFRGRGECS